MIGTRLAARRRRPVGVAIEDAPEVLERLLDGILAFWDERIIDVRHGGYRLGHDRRGRPIADSPKHLVTQARAAWFFARLAWSRFGDDRHLEWSAHGIRFLREQMWDRRHGGFVWRLDPRGPGDARKHLYGQGFGLFALSEFARAAEDADSAALAYELAELMYDRAHDDLHGGYLESRAGDWSAEPAESPSALGRPSGCKTTNAHLHLTEALTALMLVRPDERVRGRLRELIGVMSGSAIDLDIGTCWDACTRDWRPLLGYPSSYGHDLENVWLLSRACDAAGVPDAPLQPLFHALWDNALTHGFDGARGGFFDSGPRGGAANQRRKVWWVQAEGLLSALHMWRSTDAPRYRRAFELTLGWIDGVQADHVGGDWHAVIGPRGGQSGDKSGAWKDPYHQGRAVLECIKQLTPG